MQFIRKFFTKRNTQMDLTSGNLFFKFFIFFIPLAFTTILQLLYTTMDLWTVREFGGGTLSMTAVGSNTALINLIVTVFVNMSMGANVAISQAKGAGDKDKTEKVLHTSLILALISGIFVGIVGFFLSGVLLKVMNTPASIIDMATDYLKIYFVGLPFLMVYNYGSQILRALGDSTKPLLVLLIAGVINVSFDIIFVKVCQLDVIGVALGTVCAEATAAIATVVILATGKGGFVHLNFKKLRIDGESLKKVLVIGFPAGIQGLAFCIPNVMIQSSLYTITDYTINGVLISMDEIMAGSAASTQVENFAFAFEDAIGVALCSFVGQNFGAKKKLNIKKLLFISLAWDLITCALAALICGLFSHGLLSVFINDSQGIIKENAIAAGQQRLYIMIFPFILDGIMIIFGDYLRGMNISTPPAIITLIGCTGLRILFLLTLFNLPTFHTIFWLYAAYPISWVLIDLCYIPILIYFQKKVFKKLDEETSAEAKKVLVSSTQSN